MELYKSDHSTPADKIEIAFWCLLQVNHADIPVGSNQKRPGAGLCHRCLQEEIVVEQVETVVIGAGVVGLAVAKSLAESGRDVLVLEKHDAIGTETSARNSEVIHAGIYYPTGSLKAQLCVEGRHLLYAYCEERGVPHDRIQKLIVATEEAERAALEKLLKTAEANGVEDIRWITGDEVTDMEPHVRSVGGLLSPSTGIIDSHALMLSYQGDLENASGTIAFLSEAKSATAITDGFELTIATESQEFELGCRQLVNSGGLWAQTFARQLKGLEAQHVLPRHLCKGHYFTLAGRNPFSHLVYPAPAAAGLGVHVTLDIGGQVRFGPDTEWLPSDLREIDYAVDEARAPLFAAAIQRYYPDLNPADLIPAYTGVRPKIQAEGEPAHDFVIQGPQDHGIGGLVNLFGIESPGLTSSLAIAKRVAHLLAA